MPWADNTEITSIKCGKRADVVTLGEGHNRRVGKVQADVGILFQYGSNPANIVIYKRHEMDITYAQSMYEASHRLVTEPCLHQIA